VAGRRAWADRALAAARAGTPVAERSDQEDTMRSGVLGMCAAIALSGCATDAGLDDADGTATVASAISSTGITYPLPYQGGTGGNGPFTFTCYPGDVLVGLFGRGATYVDQIGLMCARLQPNGALTGEYWLGGYGGGGGSPFTAHCPAGMAVAGLAGRSHTYLDQIQVYCETPPFTYNGGYSVFGGGGWGGDWFYDMCPSGYALDSISLRWGNWIDAIQATCRYWAP
jgi:hypothetical protein